MLPYKNRRRWNSNNLSSTRHKNYIKLQSVATNINRFPVLLRSRSYNCFNPVISIQPSPLQIGLDRKSKRRVCWVLLGIFLPCTLCVDTYLLLLHAFSSSLSNLSPIGNLNILRLPTNQALSTERCSQYQFFSCNSLRQLMHQHERRYHVLLSVHNIISSHSPSLRASIALIQLHSSDAPLISYVRQLFFINR